MVKIVLGGLLIVFFYSCNTDQERLNSKALKKEIENRKIKKVNEGDIMALASQLGSEIAFAAQKSLGSSLKNSLELGGPIEALQYCQLNANPLLDSLRSQYEVEIRRVSQKIRNPEDSPTEIEELLLEAYQYSIENQLPMEDNLQKIGDSLILFSRAIILDNGICLNCHGKPDVEVLPATRDKILELYPQDNAMGHTMGDLRGMWSVTFQKKDLVLRL